MIEWRYLGYAHGIAGQTAEAQKVLRELEALSKRRYVPPEYVAVVYAGMGEKDRALEWFEKAYQQRSMHAWFLPDPRLDRVRSDARFRDLLRRMGLAA